MKLQLNQLIKRRTTRIWFLGNKLCKKKSLEL
jgi:hypothetical protein